MLLDGRKQSVLKDGTAIKALHNLVPMDDMEIQQVLLYWNAAVCVLQDISAQKAQEILLFVLIIFTR